MIYTIKINLNLNSQYFLEMSTKCSKVFEFMMLMGKLKATKRAGWLRRNVKDPESVADHMYRMATMAMIVDSQATGLCKDKCIKMALVHDMAESITGDITPFDGISKAEKYCQEEKSMDHIKNLLGSEVGVEIYDLWKEYESQSSAEARFIKDLDQFDMILQAYEYEKADQRPHDLNEFFLSTEGKIHHGMVKSWVSELKDRRNKFETDFPVTNACETNASLNLLDSRKTETSLNLVDSSELETSLNLTHSDCAISQLGADSTKIVENK